MKFKDALQNRSKKGRLITLPWLKASKINKFIILRLSGAMKNEVNTLNAMPVLQGLSVAPR